MGTHTAQEQMGRPQEMSQERFQRGADPDDASSVSKSCYILTQSLYLPQVDMRVIFDTLKKGMQAALEKDEQEETSSYPQKKEEKLRRNYLVNDLRYRYSRL